MSGTDFIWHAATVTPGHIEYFRIHLAELWNWEFHPAGDSLARYSFAVHTKLDDGMSESDMADSSLVGILTAYQTSDESMRLKYIGDEVFLKALNPWLLAMYGVELAAIVDRDGEPSVLRFEGIPAKPPVPNTDGATWDDVFDWWYRVPRGWCSNFEVLAGMIGVVTGTVRNRHSEYVAQHGKNPVSQDE